MDPIVVKKVVDVEEVKEASSDGVDDCRQNDCKDVVR